MRCIRSEGGSYMVRSLVFTSLFISLCISAGAQTTGSDNPLAVSPATEPGATERSNGGVQILSDTQGVDFSAYLKEWHATTQQSWLKLMPEEVNASHHAKGVVVIRFKILPDGSLKGRSVVLVGRSGDLALDHAAWNAIVDSHYSPLPSDFHGPYLELKAYFLYNEQPQ